MALRMLECFDYFTTDADASLRMSAFWDAGNSVSAGNGRNSTASMRVANWDQGASRTFDAQDTWIVGFAFRMVALPAGTRALVQLLDGATVHFNLGVNVSGNLVAYRGTTAGIALGTGTAVLGTGTYYYIEVKVVISDTVGVVEVRVDGVADITLSSQDTRNAANASADTVSLFRALASNAGTLDIDDLYILDGTVGDADEPNNDFWGDVRVEALLPSGAGNSAQFTPSASTNVSNVDDAAPDGDTTYNQSVTTGHIDLFAMGNLAGSGSVNGVEVVNYARKTDAGSAVLAPMLRIGSTNYTGSDDPLSTSYRYVGQVYDVSPATGVAFTTTEVDAMETGYTKTG